MASKFFGKKTEYHRLYSHMRGVDMSADNASVIPERFAYLENFWRDYGGDTPGMTESMIGFRTVYSFDNGMHALYRQHTSDGDYILIHTGTDLYRMPLDQIDAQEPTHLCTIADTDSCALSIGDACCIFDGTNMILVQADGTAGVVGTDIPAYVPTMYENGAPLEQRNFLSGKCQEQYTLALPDLFAYGSVGLVYEEDPSGDGTVRVCGIGSCMEPRLYIPSRIVRNGVEYAVRGIADEAFAACTGFFEVNIAPGVEYIGEGAFDNCTDLEYLVTPNSLRSIGKNAFRGCSLLAEAHLGVRLSSLSTDVFSGCPDTLCVFYALSAYHMSQIVGYEQLQAFDIEYNTRRNDIYVEIPIFSDMAAVTGVYVNGSMNVFNTRTDGNRIVGVQIYFADRNNAHNATIRITGNLLSEDHTSQGDLSSFFTSHPSYTGTSAEVITKCTVCASFDGRLFVSGNPDFPGTLFYSQKTLSGTVDPTYFGVLNYTTDGIGHSPIVSLLPTSDALVAFKSEDDGGGSIFYHTPQTTSFSLIPRIYPVLYTHTGLGTYGASLSFFDDPVFIGPAGVMALDKKDISSQRSIAVRSHMVSGKLLSEDLRRAKLAVFCGYLVVSVDGRMYLADSRQTFRHSSGNTEYEWYYLNGIGVYKSDSWVFRYASVPIEGFILSDTPDAVVTTKSISYYTVNGVSYPYVRKSGKRILIYQSQEKVKGTFCPATCLLGFDDRLFFGTSTGKLCTFNTDKRGQVPEDIAALPGFDADEYKETEGRRFHPNFYDYANHAVHYEMRTSADNVGIPHMTKDTVKDSFVIKCRNFGTTDLTVQVGTDRHAADAIATLPIAPFSFFHVDFSVFTWEVGEAFTVATNERKKGWIEKQITLYSDTFRQPFGMDFMAYRFHVHGKIKEF